MNAFLFTLDERQYGLSVDDVVRVVDAVEITAVPEAPSGILGIINVHGSILPVVNIRQKLGLPDKALDPSQKFIIAESGDRKIVLIADDVSGLEYLGEDSQALPDLIETAGVVTGVLKLVGEIVLICDLDRFLTEADNLDVAAFIGGGERASAGAPI